MIASGMCVTRHYNGNLGLIVDNSLLRKAKKRTMEQDRQSITPTHTWRYGLSLVGTVTMCLKAVYTGRDVGLSDIS